MTTPTTLQADLAPVMALGIASREEFFHDGSYPIHSPALIERNAESILTRWLEENCVAVERAKGLTCWRVAVIRFACGFLEKLICEGKSPLTALVAAVVARHKEISDGK